jgi:hypothetical protein
MPLQPVDITDSAGVNFAAVNDAALTGLEYGLTVRNIVAAPNASAVWNQVVVGTSSTQLTITLPAHHRRRVKIKNGGTALIYLGFITAATLAAGYRLDAGESANFDVGPAIPVFAIRRIGR